MPGENSGAYLLAAAMIHARRYFGGSLDLVSLEGWGEKLVLNITSGVN